MTFPKIEEIQATVKSIQDAKQAAAEELRAKQLQEKLPPMRTEAAELIKEAASTGRTYTRFSAEDDYGAERSAVQVLQQELRDAGYQVHMCNDLRSLEIEWKSPPPDKLEINLSLGGQLRGRAGEIVDVIDEALDYFADRHNEEDRPSEERQLIRALRKSLGQIKT